ncbi:hypothetical protein ACIGFK_06470 [Streptomyces sp. NPDC085524]
MTPPGLLSGPVSLVNRTGRVRVGFDSGPPLASGLRKGDRVTARV